MWRSTLLLAVATAGVGAAHGSSSLQPPVLPLIVRNPYLSTWLANAREEPWTRWPMFWTGEYIGFGVLVSLPSSNSHDNSSSRTVYPLLGKPHDSLRYDDPSVGYNVSYPEYLGATYDASTTNLTYKIWNNKTDHSYAKVVLSFLSPITPQSTLRQALPAAYFTISVEGTADIDIYVDLNGQWVSGDRGSQLSWNFLHDDDDRITTNEMGSLKTWHVSRAQELDFNEFNDRAEWGSLYFTAPSDVKHECGTSALLRQQFAANGTLRNQIDTDFRSIMNEEPVFAFSKSFRLANTSGKSSQKRNDSVMFTIAHVQNEVVQFASARGQTKMRPLWASWYTNVERMLAFHYNDFPNASKLAQNFSTQLTHDAYNSGGTNYVDILALSARQVLGATSFSGTPDDPLIFLKEISSNGNCQTVDVIFPAFPFFLYTNPRWGAYLLEPLIEHQLSGQYPHRYSMHDLGTHFPNQTGHADGNDEYMPVEECGDMLIMALSLVNSLQYKQDDHAQSLWSSYGGEMGAPVDAHGSAFPLSALDTVDGVPSIDDSWGGGQKGSRQAKLWVEKTYRMLEQWTSYLIEYSLEPENQLSTDDFAGWLKLQTNLALKGIIGINAMSELAEVMGDDKAARYYKNISTTYIRKWEEYGMARDQTHAKLSYNWYGSWTTLYSLFSDALLCFHPSITRNSTTTDDAIEEEKLALDHLLKIQNPENPTSQSLRSQSHKKDFIPHHIYTNQSAFYSVVMQKYGLPLDSRHLWIKSDWEFFAAAVAEPHDRKEIVKKVAKWVNETSTDLPFTDLYWAEDDGGWIGDHGEGPQFKGRPVVGGHFAGLALGRACRGR